MSKNLDWYESVGKLLPTSSNLNKDETTKKDPAPLLPSEIENPSAKDKEFLDRYYALPANEVNKQKLPGYLKTPPQVTDDNKPETNPQFSSAIRGLFTSSGLLVALIAILYTNIYEKLSYYLPLKLIAYLLGSLILFSIGSSLFKVFTISPIISTSPKKPTPSAEKAPQAEPSASFSTVIELYMKLLFSVFDSLIGGGSSKKTETKEPVAAPAVIGSTINSTNLGFQPSAYRPFVSQPFATQSQTAPINPTTTSTFTYGTAPLNTFQTTAPATTFQPSTTTATTFPAYRPLNQFTPPAPTHPKYHPAVHPTGHKEALYQDQLIPGMSYLDPTSTISEFKLQDSQYQLIQQLRHWISKHLLKSLTEAIKGIDQFLTEQQLPHLTLLRATLPLEEMATIFDTQPVNTNFPTSLRELFKLSPQHPAIMGRLQLERYLNFGEYECREYMIYRICKLAEGDFLTHYRWNSGGDSRDHWTHEYPTDSELIFHLFCTYIDLNCSHDGPSWLTNRSFSKELRLGWNRRPHDLKGIFIKELEPNHLKYGVIDMDRLVDIPEGRFNLFLTLIVYLTLVRDKLQGRIGLFDANSKTYELLEVLKL